MRGQQKRASVYDGSGRDVSLRFFSLAVHGSLEAAASLSSVHGKLLGEAAQQRHRT